MAKKSKAGGGESTGIIGVDEAGRGPVIGPLVISGVRVKNDRQLIDLGVKDSKDLSRNKREEFFEQIKDISEIEILVFSAEEIDERRKRMTINELEAVAFGTVINRLFKHGDKAFVDAADVREEEFGKAVVISAGKEFEIVSRHKADALYPVVSAASIIAKVTRDRLVEEIAEVLRKTLNQPMGSGYPSDPVTIEFMENWIRQEGNLPPHTRRSWETAKRLLGSSKNATLDQYR